MAKVSLLFFSTRFLPRSAQIVTMVESDPLPLIR